MEAKYGDIGTPERHKRGDLTTEIVDQTRVGIVRNVSPCHTMYQRKQINIAQFSAAKRLYDCWILGVVGKGNCEYREPTDGSFMAHILDSQVYYREQFDRGLAAAKDEKGLIMKVCIDEEYPTHRGMGGDAIAKIKDRLNKALSNVADAYGFST